MFRCFSRPNPPGKLTEKMSIKKHPAFASWGFGAEGFQKALDWGCISVRTISGTFLASNNHTRTQKSREPARPLQGPSGPKYLESGGRGCLGKDVWDFQAKSGS